MCLFAVRVCAWKVALDSRTVTRHDSAVSAVAARVVGGTLVLCSADSSGTLCTWESISAQQLDDSDGALRLLHRRDAAHEGKVVAVGITVRETSSIYLSRTRASAHTFRDRTRRLAQPHSSLRTVTTGRTQSPGQPPQSLTQSNTTSSEANPVYIDILRA